MIQRGMHDRSLSKAMKEKADSRTEANKNKRNGLISSDSVDSEPA
jgi:hypothetical protein